jgi:hypothetical protein
MSPIFNRKGFSFGAGDIVSLPASCVTGSEAESLKAKREARLQWMKERGVRYLGGPAVKHDRRSPRPPAASIRSIRAINELRSTYERPGDAIVRDLASNG